MDAASAVTQQQLHEQNARSAAQLDDVRADLDAARQRTDDLHTQLQVIRDSPSWGLYGDYEADRWTTVAQSIRRCC